MARSRALGDGRVVLSLTEQETTALFYLLAETDEWTPALQRVYVAVERATTGWTPAHLAAMEEEA